MPVKGNRRSSRRVKSKVSFPLSFLPDLIKQEMILTCRSEEMQAICLLRPDIQCSGSFFFSEEIVLLGTAFLLWGAAFLGEKRHRASSR